jgi:hypothetical protein
MTDAQTLLLILCVFYLSDCFLWIRKESLAFVSPSCASWHIAAINSLLGNSRGRFLLMNPFPPFGQIFLSHLAPLSISPDGVCAFNLQSLPWGRVAHTGQYLHFTEITGSITDGSELLINNQPFAKCASATQATGFAHLINSAAGIDVDDRERLIRASCAKQFAADEAAARLREAGGIMNPIRWMCAILFLFLFVGVPILVTFTGLLRVLIPVGFIMFALATEIAIMFYRGHKTLHPDETQERVESVIKMILCPPIAIRANDSLSKNLLSQYSPIVVADLLPGASAQQFVRSFILDLQYPLKHEIADNDSIEIMKWAASEHLKHSLEYINRSSYPKTEILLARPEKTDNSVFYCPRCGCQFVSASDSCPDCPGVGLLSFATHAEAGTRGIT